MNLAAALKPFFRPPDLRPERQIESELDEEFAFHIEQIERELIESDPAITHEEASRRARSRFGDVETLKQRCKRIAMEERIMLQKINAVLMIVVMLAVIGVSVQMYVTQRHNSLALLDISSQIANMRVEAASEARQRGWGAPLESSADAALAPSRVLVEGTVEQPGWYPITLDGATLMHEVVQAAGPLSPDHYALRVRQGSRRGAPSPDTGVIWGSHRVSDLLGDDAEKVVLRPGDEIHVYEAVAPARRTGGGRVGGPASRSGLPQTGMWNEVTEGGETVQGGAALEVISQDDITNLRAQPIAVLHLPEREHALDLLFKTAATPNLQINSHPDRFQSHGRWIIHPDGRLQINLGERYDGRVLLFAMPDEQAGP